jgi:hypothetical protein
MLLKARSGAMRHEPVVQHGHSRMALASSCPSGSHGYSVRPNRWPSLESHIDRQQASCFYQTFCQQCGMNRRTDGNPFQTSRHYRPAARIRYVLRTPAQNSKWIGICDGELVPGQISRILQLSGEQRDSDSQGFTCQIGKVCAIASPSVNA